MPLDQLFVLGIFVAVIISMLTSQRRCEAFEAQFPPISDAEFMARCRPGTNPEVALKVRKIVAWELRIKYECIYPSTQFEDLLAIYE